MARFLQNAFSREWVDLRTKSYLQRAAHTRERDRKQGQKQNICSWNAAGFVCAAAIESIRPSPKTYIFMSSFLFFGRNALSHVGCKKSETSSQTRPQLSHSFLLETRPKSITVRARLEQGIVSGSRRWWKMKNSVVANAFAATHPLAAHAKEAARARNGPRLIKSRREIGFATFAARVFGHSTVQYLPN